MLFHQVDDCLVRILNFFVSNLHVHIVSPFLTVHTVNWPTIVVWRDALLLPLAWDAFRIWASSTSSRLSSLTLSSALTSDHNFATSSFYTTLATSSINSSTVGSHRYWIALSPSPCIFRAIFISFFNFWFAVDISTSFAFVNSELLLLRSLAFLEALLVHLFNQHIYVFAHSFEVFS